MRSRWRRRVYQCLELGENLTSALLKCNVVGNISESLDASCLEVSNMTSKVPTGFSTFLSHTMPYNFPYTRIAQVRSSSLAVHVLIAS